MEISNPGVSSIGYVIAQMVANGAQLGTPMAGLLNPSEISDWDRRASDLTDYWRWFSGEALEERDQNSPQKSPGQNGVQYPLIYPLQLNPIKDAARLHSYCLWGMPQDTSGPLVRTKCDPRKNADGEIDDSARKLAAFVDDVLMDVDNENHSRAMDIDMGLASQPLGGIVMKVCWESGKNPLRPTGIRYEYYDPRNFYCRFRGKDYWNLDEAWIRTEITPDDARSYGVEVLGVKATYLEYWNKTGYWVTIDGKPAMLDGKPIADQHNWGFVPIIYVPHERINGLWGTSIVDGNIGLVKELNAREADIGDAIRMGVNDVLIGRNIRSNHPQEKQLANGQIWQDLGRNSGGEDKPELERVKAPALPVGTNEFVERVHAGLEKGLITPSIAYGEEEGSQRSGQTLYNRMFPLLSHVTHERINWSEAFALRAEMVLIILSLKEGTGITKEHLGLRKSMLWFPMVPVDRAALVDEVVKRLQAHGISVEQAVTRMGDTTDVPAEEDKIWADLERLAEINARATQVTTTSQETIADKQISAQSDLADKQAETAVQVAKSKPKPTQGAK